MLSSTIPVVGAMRGRLGVGEHVVLWPQVWYVCMVCACVCELHHFVRR